MNFMHGEVKNVLERQLYRMNNHIIQITKTRTRIIMVIMWLGRLWWWWWWWWWWWRWWWWWQWWRRFLMLFLFIITIMQGIYNYIPKTNNAPREYNVTTILWLQFLVPVMLYPLMNVLWCCICTFWSMCAVPSRVVLCSSLMCFPGVLLWYFLNDFKIVIVVSVTAGISF